MTTQRVFATITLRVSGFGPHGMYNVKANAMAPRRPVMRYECRNYKIVIPLNHITNCIFLVILCVLNLLHSVDSGNILAARATRHKICKCIMFTIAHI
jgi:hypothetical protein